MISYDETSGLVTLECDSPGCKKLHSLISTVGDQGRLAMNSLLVTMMQDGWYTEFNKVDSIKHFCPGCGASMNGVQQLAQRKLQPGSVGMPGGGIISAQELRSARSVGEAKKVRLARMKDEERGTPGLSDMDEESKEHLRSIMAKGRKVFGDG